MSMFGLVGYEADSSSEENSENSSDDEIKPSPEDDAKDDPSQTDSQDSQVEKLPNFLAGSTQEEPSTSVFRNPFYEAENAKNLVLEKHVKLIDLEVKQREAAAAKRKTRPCRRFIFGRCQHGDDCKYSHDLGTVPSAGNIETTTKSAFIKPPKELQKFMPKIVPTIEGKATINPEADSVKPNILLDKDKLIRPKVGKYFVAKGEVTRYLQPNKKVADSLYEQRVKERPWTVPQTEIAQMRAHEMIYSDPDVVVIEDKGKKRPRRAGVGDTLRPSKRSASALYQQRAKERPWTLPGGQSSTSGNR